MMSKAKALLPLIAIALLACGATAAIASSGDVIRDCSEDGVLDRKYSQKDLAGALDRLPSDIDEYTDCRGVIRRAQLAGASGSGSGHHRSKGALRGVDTSSPPNGDEQRKIDQAIHSHSGAVNVGGRPIRPGQTGAPFATAGLGTDLPTPVLLVLILLAVGMAAGGLWGFQRRWPRASTSAGTAIRGQAQRVREGVRRGISRLRR
jgi:hypothetical protein